MTQSNKRLHESIGDYLRMIESIESKAIKTKKELTKTNVSKIRAIRKMIENVSQTLQKGTGW